MREAKFSPRQTGSKIVNINLPGGVVAKMRKMILLMAAMASSFPVLPVSNKMEPWDGQSRDKGTVRVGGQGRASRRSFGNPSASLAMLTSNCAKVAAF